MNFLRKSDKSNFAVKWKIKFVVPENINVIGGIQFKTHQDCYVPRFSIKNEINECQTEHFPSQN